MFVTDQQDTFYVFLLNPSISFFHFLFNFIFYICLTRTEQEKVKEEKETKETIRPKRLHKDKKGTKEQKLHIWKTKIHTNKQTNKQIEKQANRKT